MDRIQKISRIFSLIFTALLIILPIFAIFKWVYFDDSTIRSFFSQMLTFTPLSTPDGMIDIQSIPFTPLTKVIGIFSYLLALAPILASLVFLVKIFKNYQHKIVFSAENAKYYRLIGCMFILDGLLIQSLSDTIFALAVTLLNEPGNRYLMIGFGTPNIEAIFCGAIVIVVSWVMLEASKLHEEQRYTV